MQIIFSQKNNNPDFEVVERKGLGHPDTLSDHLAEYLSVMYSRFTKDKFGVILHHNFDKVGMLGGKSSVQFGKGNLASPIRVLINGRASSSFGDEHFDVWIMLVQWSKNFFKSKFPFIDVDQDLKFFNNLSAASSPGQQKDNNEGSARNFWFQPRSLGDLPELKQLFSNDTSLGIGFAPYSRLEQVVLSIEDTLNSSDYKLKNPWIGSDIKIMGVRYKENFYITMCIPQLANFVYSSKEYKENLEKARKDIDTVIKELGISTYKLNINTRDNEEKNEFYLTAIGSSIESGDEGLVGRGNRVNRLITPSRAMTMEGAAGKNPVYHIGKVYHLFAHKLAHEIFEKFNVDNTIGIISQSGRLLNDPWVFSLESNVHFNEQKKQEIRDFLLERIENIRTITDDILNFKYPVA